MKKGEPTYTRAISEAANPISRGLILKTLICYEAGLTTSKLAAVMGVNSIELSYWISLLYVDGDIIIATHVREGPHEVDGVPYHEYNMAYRVSSGNWLDAQGGEV